MLNTMMKKAILTSIAALFLVTGTTHVLLVQYRDDDYMGRFQDKLRQDLEFDRMRTEQDRMRQEMEREQMQQRNEMEHLRNEQYKLRREQDLLGR